MYYIGIQLKIQNILYRLVLKTTSNVIKSYFIYIALKKLTILKQLNKYNLLYLMYKLITLHEYRVEYLY